MAEEERDSILERGRRRLGREEIETHYDTTLRHKEGHPVDIEVTFEVLEARGRFGSVAIVRDITGRKRTEALQEE